jgi:aminobenzoyl-glutamate utilization protein B
MGRYKGELKKYYYDPSKYETYLEQLGIPFPVLETPAGTK